MKDLVEVIAKALVENPDEVVVYVEIQEIKNVSQELCWFSAWLLS